MTLEQRQRELSNESAENINNKWLAAVEKHGGTRDKLAAELSYIAFSRISDYVTVAEGGELQAIPLTEIKKNKVAAIKKIREKTNIAESKDGETIFKRSSIEFELWDKEGAIKQLIDLRGDKPAEQIKGKLDISFRLDCDEDKGLSLEDDI